MSTLFYGKSKDLQFIPSNIGAWLTYLEKNDGKNLVIQIDRETGVRSNNQNSWLWGVVYKEIANHMGYSETEIHEIMKQKFLPPKFVKWKGKEIKMQSSTTNLNKIEFGEFIERIRSEVASFGIVIPDPVKDEAPMK
jgi:hypothetical protein